jgi:hypothetical protein
VYLDGQGVLQDYAEALFWLSLAESAKAEGIGIDQAARLRVEAASHIDGAALAKTQERTRKCVEDREVEFAIVKTEGKVREPCHRYAIRVAFFFSCPSFAPEPFSPRSKIMAWLHLAVCRFRVLP